MNISQYYIILNIPENASDEAVTRAYKGLAIKYHPDKNRDRVEWANKTMAMINEAYSEIVSYRFRYSKTEEPFSNNNAPTGTPVREADKNLYDDDQLIELFIKYREIAKDALYQFFQYRLFNIVIREERSNIRRFSRIAKSLRRIFHLINDLSEKTEDDELLQHFYIFTKMIFNFYRSSECLNRIDSYSSQREVDAFRLYRAGDEALHNAQKELFYERHNRGSAKTYIATENIAKAEKYFSRTLQMYGNTSWAVETKIKLEFTSSLKDYLFLFFSN